MDPFELSHIKPHKDQLLALCRAKLEEFSLLGYEHIQFDAFYSYIRAKVKGDIALHQLVDFILSIRVMDFMNFQTAAAYRGELDANDVVGES